LLEQQFGWKVIGEAADTQELMEQIHYDRPDLVLHDWELPGMPAEVLLKTLRETYQGLRVISLSGHNELCQVALEAGADAFASKTEPPERLLVHIRELGFPDNDSGVTQDVYI